VTGLVANGGPDSTITLTRWALTATNRTVTATAINPDLFAADPAVPAWVERIAAAAADLT